MSRYPRRRGELVGTPGPHGWTVYESENDAVHVLNESARAIWELCDGATSPEEMANAISELTGLNLTKSLREVERTIETLGALGLVGR